MNYVAMHSLDDENHLMGRSVEHPAKAYIFQVYFVQALVVLWESCLVI